MLSSPSKILRVIIALVLLGAVSYIALIAIGKANQKVGSAI